MSFFKNTLQRIATWSLISRLILFFSIFAVLAWSAAMFTSWNSDSKHIRIFYDSHMQLFAKSLAELRLDKMYGEVDRLEEILPHKRKKRLDAVNDAFSFAVFTQKGQRILSDDDDGKDLPFLTKRGYSYVEIDDEQWRVYVYPVPRMPYYILVGQEIEFRYDMIYKMLLRHMWPWLILLPLFLMGLAWILHKELKPLRTLAQSLQERQAEDTSALELSSLTPEIRPVVHALNVLFERITSLLTKERAFVSNAAHELRTPLAGLRVQAEVMEMCMDDAEVRENALQKILEGTSRCTHLVEQLLLLSRLETKAGCHTDSAPMGNIPWQILLHDALDTVHSAATIKLIDVQLEVEHTPHLKGGYAELWGIALRNMLDNAVRYTPKQGVVRAHMQERAIIIENSAPHIAEDALQQLGQRFYRPPGQKETGSGLGLAIVRHIASLHSAHVRVENIFLDGAEGVRVSVVF